jgi:hypothetical protein
VVVPRERVAPLREGDLRAEVLRGDFAAPPLFAPDERPEPVLPDLARVEALRPPEPAAPALLERELLARDDDALRPPLPARAVDAALRPPLLRPEVDEALRPPLLPAELVDALRPALLRPELEDALRPPLLRPELDEDEDPDDALAPPSIVHLPDMTRCAASATASAINEPSLVALATTLLAACVAVSAASRPASRIARRALGLALIAAAAAARPAASISLLIAALASLSTVSLEFFEEPPLPEVEREELLRADLAIALSPSVAQKTLQARNGSRLTRRCAISRHVKGHRRVSQRCPSTWSAAGDVAVRQHLRLTNTPFRPAC